MMLEMAIKILAGVVAGALAGALLSRVRTCSSESCTAKGSFILYIVAGAVCGASVAWWIVHR